MAKKLMLTKEPGKLIPFAPDDNQALQSIPNGSVLNVSYTLPRNLAFLRKFFALINLAYEYSKPSFSLVTAQERHGVNGFADFLAKHSGAHGDVLKSMAGEYLATLEQTRLNRFGELQPCKEAFRKNIIIKAGFYDLVSTPDGPVKVAQSISFGNMGDERFQEVYKGCFDVIWTEVLNEVYESQQDAEQAVNMAMNQLMSYA